MISTPESGTRSIQPKALQEPVLIYQEKELLALSTWDLYRLAFDLLGQVCRIPLRARMHHKVVGNFGSEADVRSLYFRGFRFNETSDNGACTHGQPEK